MARVISGLRLALGVSLTVFIVAWGVPAGADGILKSVISGPDSDAADVTAAQRTAAIIETLSGETVTQSFEMAGFAKDYFYPGHVDQFGDSPTGSLHTLMSNRRFSKLYAELSALSADEQYGYLSRYFDFYLTKQKGIVSKFSKGTTIAPDGYAILSVIPDGPDDAISLHGTTQALRAIAILSGMLGNGRMWPILKPALENPVTGIALDEAMYDKKAMYYMGIAHVFDETTRAETIFLMSQNAGAQVRQIGIDTAAVLAAVPSDAVQEVQVLDYRAEVTRYDVLHRFSDLSLPVDLSHGSYKIRMVMTDKREIIEKVIVAGGLQLAPLSVPAGPSVF